MWKLWKLWKCRRKHITQENQPIAAGLVIISIAHIPPPKYNCNLYDYWYHPSSFRWKWVVPFAQRLWHAFAQKHSLTSTKTSLVNMPFGAYGHTSHDMFATSNFFFFFRLKKSSVWSEVLHEHGHFLTLNHTMLLKLKPNNGTFMLQKLQSNFFCFVWRF